MSATSESFTDSSVAPASANSPGQSAAFARPSQPWRRQPVSDRRDPNPPGPPASAAVRPLLRIRVRPDNANHHLWNNHGTWFLHYTVHPTPFTKERVRRSLGTPSLAAARERRDVFFAHLRTEAIPLAAVA